jgi:pimeloyl-ACP methyl ester carboxylesterase
MGQEILPFLLDVPEAQLADLRQRLRQTRWPATEPVSGWSQGVPLEYLRDLCGYWANGYDWRAAEARLNALPLFQTEIDGVRIVFAHVRSPRPDALPLVLTHGWPGSVVEFGKAIGPLADPAAHGGDEADAFHVVCPCLPGYGFSGQPEVTGWGVERIARAWAVLMARLGYPRYGAAGSDWGTSISVSVGQQDREHVAGIHLVPPLAGPDPATFGELTEAEREAMASLEYAAEWDSGYSREHATRPQTVGYGLTDSPAFLAAWIVEKFWSWTDHPGSLEEVLSRDDLLDNLMLYWLPGTGASAARLYWESIRQVNEWISGDVADTVSVPAGCSVFPRELQRPSRRWAERRFTDIRYWGEPERGGHFAAFEQPRLFADELRAFFRLVRLVAAELAVGDAVRAGGLGAEALDLVLLVGLEVALEPEPVRAALPGQDVGRDPVQEPAVVAGDHRAAGELQQRVLQAGQGIDVEVVGRLVQQQQVAALLEGEGQVHPVALAARHDAGRLLLV